MQAKMRTIRRFLACWDLPLVPYTVEVVYALGAALKWRKYRSAADYLYLSKVVAEREGAYISQATPPRIEGRPSQLPSGHWTRQTL